MVMLLNCSTGTADGTVAVATVGAYAVAGCCTTVCEVSAPVILHSSTLIVPYDLDPFFAVNGWLHLSNSLTDYTKVGVTY